MNKTFLKSIGILLLVSILSTIGYLSYFFLIGAPRTQARTYYNLGIAELDKDRDDSKEKAKEYFESGLKFWPENYISEELAKL